MSFQSTAQTSKQALQLMLMMIPQESLQQMLQAPCQLPAQRQMPAKHQQILPCQRR